MRRRRLWPFHPLNLQLSEILGSRSIFLDLLFRVQLLPWPCVVYSLQPAFFSVHCPIFSYAFSLVTSGICRPSSLPLTIRRQMFLIRTSFVIQTVIPTEYSFQLWPDSLITANSTCLPPPLLSFRTCFTEIMSPLTSIIHFKYRQLSTDFL